MAGRVSEDIKELAGRVGNWKQRVSNLEGTLTDLKIFPGEKSEYRTGAAFPGILAHTE